MMTGKLLWLYWMTVEEYMLGYWMDESIWLECVPCGAWWPLKMVQMVWKMDFDGLMHWQKLKFFFDGSWIHDPNLLWLCWMIVEEYMLGCWMDESIWLECIPCGVWWHLKMVQKWILMTDGLWKVGIFFDRLQIPFYGSLVKSLQLTWWYSFVDWLYLICSELQKVHFWLFLFLAKFQLSSLILGGYEKCNLSDMVSEIRVSYTCCYFCIQMFGSNHHGHCEVPFFQQERQFLFQPIECYFPTLLLAEEKKMAFLLWNIAIGFPDNSPVNIGLIFLYLSCCGPKMNTVCLLQNLLDKGFFSETNMDWSVGK